MSDGTGWRMPVGRFQNRMPPRPVDVSRLTVTVFTLLLLYCNRGMAVSKEGRGVCGVVEWLWMQLTG